MKLSDRKIQDIADNLEIGLICYVHKETHEIESLADPDDVYADPELWEEGIQKVENDFEKYLKVEKMPSREAFQVMSDFTDEVLNPEIRERLIYALNRNQPFRNFKYEVDYDMDVRQQWFDFKAKKNREWVKSCIKEEIELEKYRKTNK